MSFELVAYIVWSILNLAKILTPFADIIVALTTLFGLFIAIYTIRQNTEQQKLILFHDMVKEAFGLRKLLLEHEKSRNKNYKLVRQIYFDYWEYLAFLINRKKIDAKEAVDLFYLEFQKLIGKLEKHKPEEEEYTELRKLVKDWG